MSLNLCVRASDDLEGAASRSSEMKTAGWRTRPAPRSSTCGRDQHGVEPVVRRMRDTVVLRLFAAAHRRAPAETAGSGACRRLCFSFPVPSVVLTRLARA